MSTSREDLTLLLPLVALKRQKAETAVAACRNRLTQLANDRAALQMALADLDGADTVFTDLRMAHTAGYLGKLEADLEANQVAQEEADLALEAALSELRTVFHAERQLKSE